MEKYIHGNALKYYAMYGKVQKYCVNITESTETSRNYNISVVLSSISVINSSTIRANPPQLRGRLSRKDAPFFQRNCADFNRYLACMKRIGTEISRNDGNTTEWLRKWEQIFPPHNF